MKKIICALLTLTLLAGGIISMAEKEYDSLYTLSEEHGFSLGGCLSYSQLRDAGYLIKLSKHFNSVTATNEMKAYSLLDQRASRRTEDGMPAMNYTQADKMVEWAQKNGIGVRGHVLVWDAYMVDWFFHEDYDTGKPYADQNTIRMRTEYYIREVITHFEEKFPGVVYCWDVVNEAVGEGILEYNFNDKRRVRTMRDNKDNLFYKYMGADYVEHAFLYAKNTVEELGADIKLFYNDYNTFNTDKMLAIRNLVMSINNFAFDPDGNPRKLCDGVGMQGYIGGWGTQTGCMNESDLKQIKNAINAYAYLGVEVHITEMAVRNYEKDKAHEHAEFYAKLMKMIKEIQKEKNNPVTNITIWGLIDQPFLAKDNYSYRQNGPYCGLFDERMNYKESFDLVYEELMAE